MKTECIGVRCAEAGLFRYRFVNYFGSFGDWHTWI